MPAYYVYIMASKTRVLYTGITNNLERRYAEHTLQAHPGFTQRYKVIRLVHVEVFSDVREAIAREKMIKGWTRQKKIALIEASNPLWENLCNTALRHDSA